MDIRLDPSVLDMARRALNVNSDRALGEALGVSVPTVRAYRRGTSVPSLRVMVELKRLTGRPLDTMCVAADALAKSA
ncbi:hypothetical protein CPHO_07240 [Corynebacterium phocae]|uniref:HTH cro/C1-type domain-containing protein n=1 Tax=Corynebacterium phocae TaxID=161895 RepID=A0A1L7D3L7_9CORY|nr:helix-turn-helix transcriptional regulator [Corynebacterium phocae]APT92718.1 hypothetical protein CPHO_07240 [Corynebacterium phocae]KAA8723025.1 helix-turn-helix transcriptional regulator [Corynebacterium phocae]